jgi:hypothetical protein
MTATTTHTSTTLAREPCAGCGAPLGDDQRYCLSCGVPRAGTRLPFLDVLHAEAAGAGIVEHDSRPASLLRVPALTPTASGGLWGVGGHGGAWGVGGGTGPRTTLLLRLRENSGLFALLGVLLLALLIGLLLGHWVSGGTRTPATVPAKEIVEVKGLQGLAATPTTAGASAAGGTAASAGSAGGAEAATVSGATHTGSGGSSAAAKGSSAASSASKHASTPTVSQLATSTGKEHAQAVEKALSKGGGTLTTGASPPPTKATPKSGSASTPIGGGSEVATIE